VLKPSGHGDLSDGRFLTTASISACVKGAIKLERSIVLSKSDGRPKSSPIKLLVPNQSLKEF
jgi:hypothetical protein